MRPNRRLLRNAHRSPAVAAERVAAREIVPFLALFATRLGGS